MQYLTPALIKLVKKVLDRKVLDSDDVSCIQIAGRALTAAGQAEDEAQTILDLEKALTREAPDEQKKEWADGLRLARNALKRKKALVGQAQKYLTEMLRYSQSP